MVRASFQLSADRGRNWSSGKLMVVLLALVVGCGEPDPVPSGQNPFSGSPSTPGPVQPPRAISSGQLTRGAPPPVASRVGSGDRRTSGPPASGGAATNGTAGDGTSSGPDGSDALPQFPEEDRAIAEATRLIDENPFTTHVAYNNRAVAYYGKGDLERALADLNRALEIKPDYAEALKNRSVVYDALGEPSKARADLAAAKRLGQ
jgi:hypothetical protein